MVVKSLEQLLRESSRRFRSFHDNRQQLSAELLLLERAIDECPHQDPAKCAWLKWAGWKIRSIINELECIQRRMDKESWIHHHLAMRFEANAPTIKAEAAAAFRATMTAITGPKIVKGKNRRYVAKGESSKSPTPKPEHGKKHKQGAPAKKGQRDHQHGNRQAA